MGLTIYVLTISGNRDKRQELQRMFVRCGNERNGEEGRKETCLSFQTTTPQQSMGSSLNLTT